MDLMSLPLWAWIVFYVLVFLMLIADLKMFGKKGQQQPPCHPCQRRRLLPVPEFLHEHPVYASFHEREDGVVPSVDDEVHLPVFEACPVRFLRPFLYAHAASDVGGFCLVLP